VRGGEAIGIAALVGEVTRVVVTGVRGWPLQHEGRVGGEAPIYSRENSARGGLNIKGVVGGAFGHFPTNNGGLRRREEDKRQGRSAGAVVECSCG
jgi:hypothetical protein